MRWGKALAAMGMVLFLAGCPGGDGGARDAAPAVEPGAQASAAEVGHTAGNDAAGPAEVFVAEAAPRRTALTGFTRARTLMTLVSEESGRVHKVVADVGDTLGEHGLFAELDTTFIELDLEGNRADQQRLQSELTYNKKEMERYERLVRSNNAPQSTLDNNIRAHQSALQQLRAKQIEERVLVERMKRFSLLGPPGWQVVSRFIEPGEWLISGAKVAELGRYDVLLVPFALSSEEYRALGPRGSEVTLRLTDLGQDVAAAVARVSPGFDAQSRKINVDLEIAQGDFEFRGGLRVELLLDLKDPGGAVLVPASALIKAYEEHFLMTPDGERVHVVLLGAAGGGMRRVSGQDVRAGDTFLLHP
ncbi:HlyD family efflux transporter periplasmic adaptor subunit [Pseudodesulfovibrio sp. F-1]|uniref:HlyD family efflux transporter periplasmic adaptor subunit n=1 Tax=Pseudodesulfovibrio alkaliphilus TaxID=2661613 RepID=A0A7K1KNH7_9BACT|nr:efflux RND transporter periplasmic adaptor subunit [Pseudodesulfovibrio alkaliphilus]MUM77633.1 HlyD family efflux transporter periplasmic adaptor subunit [Pseudodesulfovibrio alkaliphilus]